MAESFAEQLSKAKLKSSKEKTKDFSDPKLAGFLTKEDILTYQKHVLEANTEQWHKYISSETFPTYYFPLNRSDAEYFIRIFEKNFQKLHQNQSYDEIRKKIKLIFKENEDMDEKNWFENIEQRLKIVIEQFFPDGKGFFAKTSSRSAKDATIFRDDFIKIYQNQLMKCSNPTEENSRLISLLNAAFLCLRLRSASELLLTFLVSERIYQDMLLAIETHRSLDDSFNENIVLRPFTSIDIDMEFRGFVYQQSLTCLSQYNYLIYSSRLFKSKEIILKKIQTYFDEIIKIKLINYQLKDYVIDFALTKTDENDESIESMKIWVIEINPFMETTDGALFSWQHERQLIEGKSSNEKPIFRITERTRPGSWSMLPISIRQWIPNQSIKTNEIDN